MNSPFDIFKAQVVKKQGAFKKKITRTTSPITSFYRTSKITIPAIMLMISLMALIFSIQTNAHFIALFFILTFIYISGGLFTYELTHLMNKPFEYQMEEWMLRELNQMGEGSKSKFGLSDENLILPSAIVRSPIYWGGFGGRPAVADDDIRYRFIRHRAFIIFNTYEVTALHFAEHKLCFYKGRMNFYHKQDAGHQILELYYQDIITIKIGPVPLDITTKNDKKIGGSIPPSVTISIKDGTTLEIYAIPAGAFQITSGGPPPGTIDNGIGAIAGAIRQALDMRKAPTPVTIENAEALKVKLDNPDPFGVIVVEDKSAEKAQSEEV